MKETTALKIIDEICMEKNIEVAKLSFGWIRELKKDGEVRHIVRNTFDLNAAGCMYILNDKYATYEVLKQNNIDTLKHVMLFNPSTRKDVAGNLELQVEQALKEFNGKVVIKANNSSEGKDVFLLNNKEDIILKAKELFQKGFDGVSICPFKDIETEYRVIYLDGNIEYIYKKEKPYVIGDGKRNVEELARNIGYEAEYKADYIPDKNEKFIISWKHNLSSGAIATEVLKDDKYIDEVRKIAIEAAKATSVKFATIDISQTSSGKIFVMEINGSVCMSKFAENFANGYEIAKKIYSKAIDKMFAGNV